MVNDVAAETHTTRAFNNDSTVAKLLCSMSSVSPRGAITDSKLLHAVKYLRFPPSSLFSLPHC